MPSPSKKLSSVAQSTRSQIKYTTNPSPEDSLVLDADNESTSATHPTSTSTSTSTSTTVPPDSNMSKRVSDESSESSLHTSKRPKRCTSKAPSTNLRIHLVNGNNHRGLVKILFLTGIKKPFIQNGF